MLAEAERTCGALQSTASRLEGCLAELDRWNTDSLDCQQHLKETKYSGRSALGSTARVSHKSQTQSYIQSVTFGLHLWGLHRNNKKRVSAFTSWVVGAIPAHWNTAKSGLVWLRSRPTGWYEVPLLWIKNKRNAWMYPISILLFSLGQTLTIQGSTYRLCDPL